MIEEHVPGGVAQAIEDADTFFSTELPALQNWTLTREQARTIVQPVLSVLGGRTEPLFVEAAELLRRGLPRVEECTIEASAISCTWSERSPSRTVSRSSLDATR